MIEIYVFINKCFANCKNRNKLYNSNDFLDKI